MLVYGDEIKDLPDHVYLVLKPEQSLPGNPEEQQLVSLNINLCGIIGYLPIYKDYQQAIKDHPNAHIHIMDLIEYKKEIGRMSSDKVI